MLQMLYTFVASDMDSRCPTVGVGIPARNVPLAPKVRRWRLHKGRRPTCCESRRKHIESSLQSAVGIDQNSGHRPSRRLSIWVQRRRRRFAFRQPMVLVSSPPSGSPALARNPTSHPVWGPVRKPTAPAEQIVRRGANLPTCDCLCWIGEIAGHTFLNGTRQ